MKKQSHLGRSELGIRPVLGKCLVEPDMMIEGEIGGIIIPTSAVVNHGIGFTGVVVAEAPREGTISGMVGRRVTMATWAGAQFEWQGRNFISLPLTVDVFLAVLYEGVWVKIDAKGRAHTPGEAGVQRCRWCRSKGQANILLTPAGYCPQCERYPGGNKRERPKITIDPITGEQRVQHVDSVTEEEKELYGGQPTPKAEKGTIYSYPGQGKR